MKNIILTTLLIFPILLQAQNNRIEFCAYGVVTDKGNERKFLDIPNSGIKVIIDTLSEIPVIGIDFQLKTKDFVHKINPAIAAPDTSDILLYDSKIGGIALRILNIKHLENGLMFYAGRTDSSQSNEMIKALWIPKDSIFSFQTESKDRMSFLYTKSIKETNLKTNKARRAIFDNLTE